MADTSPPPSGGGLFASLRGLASTLLSILHTRVELLSVELEEEKLRLLRMLAWGGIAVFFGCVGFVFLAALVCVVFWEEHRVLALSLVTLTFWLVAGWAAWRVQTSARSAASFLSASLAELQRDVEALRVQAQQAAASSEREQP